MMISIRPFARWFFISLLSLAAIFTTACSSKTELSEPVSEAQPSPKPTGEIRPCKTEPLFSLIPDVSRTKNMETAWRKFVASGRYRLACETDGDFALNAAEPKTTESYSLNKQSRSMFNWGAWNYPKRPYEDHLAVIVVDTTRTDANRFGLVVFSPPRTEKDAYDINWLYQNRDLTRASVGMASGSGWVRDYTTDGKANLCWIVWNRSRKIFECKSYSP